jgi:hypothetical protein
LSFDSPKPLLLGIAIKRTEDGFHTGLIYCSKKDEPWMMHLAWHLIYKHESLPANEYHWVRISYPLSRLKASVKYCEHISKRIKGIPYGNRYLGGQINEKGKYIPSSEEENGLTCATFILAILKGMGIQLIDIDSWQSRPNDVDFQNWIVSKMQKSSEITVKEEHIEKIKEKHGIRYRAEEVTGAASLAPENRPVKFSEALIPAEEIRKSLSPILTHSMPSVFKA